MILIYLWRIPSQWLRKQTCIRSANAINTCEDRAKTWLQFYEGFHTRAKVQNLNDHLSYRIILMTIFWPVCTQISITNGNLNCAIQIMIQRCFPVTHLSNHAAKSLCEVPWPLHCDLGAELCDLLTTSTCKPHIFYYILSQMRKQSACHQNTETSHASSPRSENAKPQTWRSLLSRVYTRYFKYCDYNSSLQFWICSHVKTPRGGHSTILLYTRATTGFRTHPKQVLSIGQIYTLFKYFRVLFWQFCPLNKYNPSNIKQV